MLFTYPCPMYVRYLAMRQDLGPESCAAYSLVREERMETHSKSHYCYVQQNYIQSCVLL